jgi:DNA-binding beta-propeller fold protein YncE
VNRIILGGLGDYIFQKSPPTRPQKIGMNFLTPIPVDINRSLRVNGGIAVNVDGTLVASADSNGSCVYICSVRDPTARPFVTGAYGSTLQLASPRTACFVHRGGVDTLLICDFGIKRVVEVTARGEFMRAIALPEDSHPWGIAERDGVIAVSLLFTHMVVLLQYESGAVKPEVTIGSGTQGNADGQLNTPMGVAFTSDGRYILVADYFNHRVSKFSAASGAFVAHVVSNGIRYPADVLQCEDGSIVVAHREGMTCVGKDGATVEKFGVSSGSSPSSLSYSPSLNGVVVKCSDGSVFVLRDAWSHSLRCAWVHACVRLK